MCHIKKKNIYIYTYTCTYKYTYTYTYRHGITKRLCVRNAHQREPMRNETEMYAVSQRRYAKEKKKNNQKRSTAEKRQKEKI